MKGLIHCDSCHHEQPENDIAVWHNKPCPKCGSPEIINDDDYAHLLVMEALISTGLVTQEPTDKPGVQIRINTAGLRK